MTVTLVTRFRSCEVCFGLILLGQTCLINLMAMLLTDTLKDMLPEVGDLQCSSDAEHSLMSHKPTAEIYNKSSFI